MYYIIHPIFMYIFPFSIYIRIFHVCGGFAEIPANMQLLLYKHMVQK